MITITCTRWYDWYNMYCVYDPFLTHIPCYMKDTQFDIACHYIGRKAE